MLNRVKLRTSQRRAELGTLGTQNPIPEEPRTDCAFDSDCPEAQTYYV